MNENRQAVEPAKERKSYQEALKEAEEHKCYRIHFCQDVFLWNCPKCGREIQADGETIHWHTNGLCQICEHAYDIENTNQVQP